MQHLFQVHSKQIFHGPNLYVHTPIVIFNIQINSTLHTKAVSACHRIIKLFPEWFQKNISKDLEAELYIGNVLSCISLGLLNQDQDEINVSGAKSAKNGIYLWAGFHSHKVTTKAIDSAFQILLEAIKNDKLSREAFKDLLQRFNNFHQRTYSINKYLLKLSNQFNIPVFPYIDNSIYTQFGWGKRSRVFLGSSSMEDSFHGVNISMDKSSSKKILQNIGVPIAKSLIIHSIDQLETGSKVIGFPCVIKPIRGTQGTGITANIQDFNELRNAFIYAKKSTFGKNPIMIESFIEGDDYRLMVVNGKYVGAVQRIPSFVVGDGQSTIKKLIYDLNERRMNSKQDDVLDFKQVSIDNALIMHLKKQSVSMNKILEKNKKITLSSLGSYATGGIVKDVTGIVHPQIKYMAEMIAQTSNIATLGIDYITTDISKPYKETNGAVTEYNHYPSLDFYKFIANPKELLYQTLNIGSGRIPLIIVIVEPLKFLEVQKWLTNNITNHTIGWVCGNNAHVGTFPLKVIDTSGWGTVKMLLRQKRLEKALIVCSPREIIQKGLPIDKADHICMCDINITDDWYSVIRAATSNVKQFDDISVLFPFLFEEYSL